jgi:hypothetical protein
MRWGCALLLSLGPVGVGLVGCGSDEEPPPPDELLTALSNAQSIQVAAIFDGVGSSELDAGSADPGGDAWRNFHDQTLMSHFVELSAEQLTEIRTVFASAQNYRATSNACADHDLAVRIVTSREVIEVIIGLSCSNVTFIDHRTEYMYDQPLFRIAAVAQELIPYVDASEVLH